MLSPSSWTLALLALAALASAHPNVESAHQFIRFEKPNHCDALETGQNIDVTWTFQHMGLHLPPVSLYLAHPGCPHMNHGWKLIEPPLVESVPVCHGSLKVSLPQGLAEREDYAIFMRAQDDSFFKVSEPFWVSPGDQVEDIGPEDDIDELLLVSQKALAKVQVPLAVEDWLD